MAVRLKSGRPRSAPKGNNLMVEPKEPRKARRVLSAKAVGYKAGKKKGFFSQPIDAVIRKIVSASPTLALRHQPAKSNRAKGDSCYFINRFADLLNTNFLPARVNAKIDEISAIIAPEMNDQYFRWKAPQDNGDWQYHIGEEKTFANQRPSNQRNHIRSKFSISSSKPSL